MLEALKDQTLPKEQWQLLLIDNASKEPLASAWDLSWHPQARHIREDELGLTPARLRGIRESTGEYLVFVDDDNVLARNYVEESISLFEHWPMLGAIGAGVCKGEYEIAPPEQISRYLGGLPIFEMDRNYWASLYGNLNSTPVGAGLCVRRSVAKDYAQKTEASPLRRLLGHSGTNMGGGDDFDLAYCAIDLGMGVGRFVSLELTHLIPKARLTEDYMIRLWAGFAWCHEILPALRPGSQRDSRALWKPKVLVYLNICLKRGIERRVMIAAEKARYQARKLIASHLASL
ncbi:MAG: glycosyltransferase [Methylacidiphilales bacterium]|nr:glycosyltransferase [Candidatus Methylacidiphilales bacterium]